MSLASATTPDTVPTAAFALAEAAPSCVAPPVSAVERAVEKSRAAARVVPMRLSACPSAVVSAGTCPLNCVSVPCAVPTAFLVAAIVSSMPPSDSRTSATASLDERMCASRPDCVVAAWASKSTPSSLACATSVLLTVETNVSLICSSMVSAPVSVTLGAMAFFFSLT